MSKRITEKTDTTRRGIDRNSIVSELQCIISTMIRNPRFQDDNPEEVEKNIWELIYELKGNNSKEEFESLYSRITTNKKNDRVYHRRTYQPISAEITQGSTQIVN